MKIFRNILSFCLALCFFVSVSGVNIYKHYCGDFLAEVSVYIQSNPCADEGGEDACSKDKTTSCCDDEIEFHQLNVNLILNKDQVLDFNDYSLAETLFDFVSIKSSIDFKPINSFNRGPPELNSIPIYKRLKRFTFYG